MCLFPPNTLIVRKSIFNHSVDPRLAVFRMPLLYNSCSPIGPNVTIVTPLHPMVADERRAIRTAQGEEKQMCYARLVHIGKDCWIGASVTICPGVTIGDGCVIDAGAVVTRDIPSNSFAAGVPCRVIREITQADSMRNKPEILADNQVINMDEK